VYVDTFPMTGPMDPSFEGDEWPLPAWDWLAEDGNSIEGLSDEQLAAAASLAVPEPAAALRDRIEATNPARTSVPTVMLCTGLPSAQVRTWIEEGSPWVSELAALTDVEWIDLPTGHWPMWSQPLVTAEILAKVAAEHG
jgi:hypothetical protein